MAWLVKKKSAETAGGEEDFFSSTSPSAREEGEGKNKKEGENEVFSFSFHLDTDWIILFLDSAPAILFFSSLSLIVLFWAKIYYAAILVAYPRLFE